MTAHPAPVPAQAPVDLQSAAARIRASRIFEVEDIPLLRDLFVRYNFAAGSPWDDFRGSFLRLPDWFRFDLDPMSEAYASQQHRLWGVIAGVDRPYEPELDEETTDDHADPVRLPGYYIRRDPLAIHEAAHQTLASGVILSRCGLKAGDWALEYGAGFGLTALQLARLGVNVDTVDISSIFCRHVKAQADFYRVPLTPFRGPFGWNPRPERRYDFIWFFECFHHCVEFRSVVHQIKKHLAPHGILMLAGEGIQRRQVPVVPYPWGMRVESDVVAIVREKHWFELGFTEDFIEHLFVSAGYRCERVDFPGAPYGEGYVFRHRGDHIDLATHWMPTEQGETWNQPEPAGRWTKADSRITLDATDSFRTLEIDISNCHAFAQVLEVEYGPASTRVHFAGGEIKTLVLDAATKVPTLRLRTQTHRPPPQLGDPRSLGLLVHRIRYR